MIRCRNRKELREAIQKTVPNDVGVYLFRNRFGKTIYIGKSVNLRARMLSYFRREYDTVEPRIGQMIQGIDGYLYFIAKTELQALLVEDYLIKRELPEFNMRQKQFEEYRYLLLTHDSFPAFQIAPSLLEEQKQDAFGPYRDGYFISKLLDIVCRYYPVRRCSDPVPKRICMNYDIAMCAGPCRDAISVENYRALVECARKFLRGRDPSIIQFIRRDMEEAAAKRLYEKAERFKERLHFCMRFFERQIFLGKFKTQELRIKEKGLPGITHHFKKGSWVKGCEVIFSSTHPHAGNLRHVNFMEQDPRFVVDRANIIYNWIRKNRATCEYLFFT